MTSAAVGRGGDDAGPASVRSAGGPLIVPVHLRAAEGRFSEPVFSQAGPLSGKASVTVTPPAGPTEARPLAASAGQASLMPGQAEFGRVSRRRPTVARTPEPTQWQGRRESPQSLGWPMDCLARRSPGPWGPGPAHTSRAVRLPSGLRVLFSQLLFCLVHVTQSSCPLKDAQLEAFQLVLRSSM
jgi:hypothetical protein